MRVRRMTNAVAVSAAVSAVAMSGLLFATPAAASGGGGVERTGACSGRSTWDLKAKYDDGRIEVEFEVDTPRVGRTWNVTIRDNTVLVFSGSRVTQAPSGSFEVERRVVNRAGVDHFVARARDTVNGELCVGRVDL